MKKLFTLLLSLTMVVVANAADKFAQGPISWSTGPWYDAATAGNVVTAPVAGDNVNAGAFKITVDVDATCDNYTVEGTGVAGNLVISANKTLTVRGTMNCPTSGDVDLMSGSAADSKLKLTGEALAINGTLGSPKGTELLPDYPIVYLITNNMVRSIRPRGILEIATVGSGIFSIGLTQPNTINLSNCKIVVKSGSSVNLLGRTNIGKVDGTNEFTIESGATVYSRIIEGAFDGRKVPAAKMILNGTLIASDRTSVRTIEMGANGVFKTTSGSATTNGQNLWDGWWNNGNTTNPVLADGQFGTPTSLTFAAGSTSEFNNTANQNILGIVPANKVYYYFASVSNFLYYNSGNLPPNVEGTLFPAQVIPYNNIIVSGGNTKTVQSNLTATGNVTIAAGTLSIPAGIVMVVNGTVTGTPTVAGALINAKSVDNTMGTVTSTISATNEVALVAVPKSGYIFVNWTEASSEISTSATLAAFTPANLDNRTIIANFVVDPSTGLSTSKANTFVTVVGSTLRLHGNVTAVEVFDAQGRRLVSQANVTSVTAKGTGIYIVRMHTAHGVNTQKVNVNKL